MQKGHGTQFAQWRAVFPGEPVHRARALPLPASLVSYRPLAKISPPTEEEGSRLGIGFELRIVIVLGERNELLRDVASRFASVRRTRGFAYDLSRHGRSSARPTFSSHLAAFFSRCRTTYG